ncbi:U-box and intein containing von Willebrand factor type A isoform B [Micractinium conductrix]|uniref:U-box and intein containing von Willebrand factor type A isoform A n=1 Tax=Micractinium conductrix TaxID=554055 RepID=A0A2P6VGU0_9CHLO|nr:U-box and intein containing von Willebrand factor type A isoform A [Micractinium conductrix]PSC73306.1 U-box and intein containing von Willebrand factor type A isoform B [Micractinium conductrix]|eukprot:PSC73305.1 U-box and intein containing von Willebrand factor type A isoform A [Micractinium conductrix]
MLRQFMLRAAAAAAAQHPGGGSACRRGVGAALTAHAERAYSPEPTDNGDSGPAEPKPSSDVKVNVAVMRNDLSHLQNNVKEMKAMLEDMVGGKTPYQQAEAAALREVKTELREVKTDTNMLVLWRTRVVAAGTVVGAMATAVLSVAVPAGRPASPATQPTPPALDDDLLQQLCCPITHEPMSDPMVATFGHTYERAAIEGWIARQAAAGQAPAFPLTHEPLRSTDLRPSHTLRAMVVSFLERGLLR